LSASDDELDAELRRLFGDERLTVRSKTDAPEAIVAGARRIRRRRTAMMSASGAVVAVVLVGGSLTFGPFRSQDNVAAMNTSVLKTGAPPQVVNGSMPPVPTAETSTPGSPPSTSVGVPPGLPDADKPTTSKNAPVKPPPSSGKPAPQFITTGGLLSPTGYGSLKLDTYVNGPALADVTLTPASPGATACTGYNFSGDGVPGPGFANASPATPGGGGGYIVAIVPNGVVHTPEGIGKGSTKDDVKQKYPGAGNSEAGLYAPASATSVYQFSVDSAGLVQGILLEKINNGC
jgi:hypothetical protein